MQVSRTTRKVRPDASHRPCAAPLFYECDRVGFRHRLTSVLTMRARQRRREAPSFPSVDRAWSPSLRNPVRQARVEMCAATHVLSQPAENFARDANINGALAIEQHVGPREIVRDFAVPGQCDWAHLRLSKHRHRPAVCESRFESLHVRGKHATCKVFESVSAIVDVHVAVSCWLTSTHHQRRFRMGERRLVHAMLGGRCCTLHAKNHLC